MLYESRAPTWPFPIKLIPWVRLLARLCSPLAIAWYLLTRSELSVQIRSFVFEIKPREEKGDRNRGFIVWSYPDERKFRTFLGFKIFSERDTYTPPSTGEPIAFKFFRIEFRSIFLLTASSATEAGLRLQRFANIILFIPWPAQEERLIFPHIMPVDVGPISINFWLRKPSANRPRKPI